MGRSMSWTHCPLGALKNSKSLSHRKKLAGGYPHLFCPRLGQGSYLQCLFGDGVSLQAGDHFQYCHHVPDLKNKNQVSSAQVSALSH